MCLRCQNTYRPTPVNKNRSFSAVTHRHSWIHRFHRLGFISN